MILHIKNSITNEFLCFLILGWRISLPDKPSWEIRWRGMVTGGTTVQKGKTTYHPLALTSKCLPDIHCSHCILHVVVDITHTFPPAGFFQCCPIKCLEFETPQDQFCLHIFYSKFSAKLLPNEGANLRQRFLSWLFSDLFCVLYDITMSLCWQNCT